MTVFLRLLSDTNKMDSLVSACDALRTNRDDARLFEVVPESFRVIPGAPFAYWVGDSIRKQFSLHPPFEGGMREARRGASSGDDFRRIRIWYEILHSSEKDWRNLVKGGVYSPFYCDVFLVIAWDADRETLFGFFGRPGRETAKVEASGYFFRPGLTWPRRTTSGISMRAMPEGCIFADKGPASFVAGDSPQTLLALCALANSEAFAHLVSLQLAAADTAARSYEVGVVQRTPVPAVSIDRERDLAELARQAWSYARGIDTVEETSHAFLLPISLRSRLGWYDVPSMQLRLRSIHDKIDEISFKIYGFNVDHLAHAQSSGGEELRSYTDKDETGEDDEVEVLPPGDPTTTIFSWTIGVAFGRFDWRLATGERAVPPEPDPFDPLPAKSPGMLPDDAAPFHHHAGILTDDPGHPHDLPALMEAVLTRVQAPVPADLRRWLQRDFFPFHLQRYSKSRRKAPIYWPLATSSGSYTLWLYYPSLTSQTLYTAVNDFVEPKLKQVTQQATTLRTKASARTRDEDRTLETLLTLEAELIELRDTMLRIAPDYRPNHDDGVQITAAPLWPLFRHKPWQKLLKETWAKLENGDYDWAHLAMAYWPDRVREKCKADKSLAIAHDLEQLYIEPPAKPAKPRGRKKGAAA